MLPCVMSIRNDSDRGLVEELFNRYGSLMLSIANKYFNDTCSAEDAVSLAFEKIIKNLQKINFEDCNKTKRLLVIIIRNTCADMRRREPKYETVPLDDCEEADGSGAESLPELLVSEETCEAVLACLGKMKAEHKDILRLKYDFNYTDEQIAQLLGIKAQNARVRLHRARKALIEEMRKRGVGCE